jgi:hypothetical protein
MLWCSGEENEEEKIMLEEEKMSTIEFLSQKNKVIIKTK